MNHRFLKVTASLAVIGLMLILINACSQQTSNSKIVVPEIPQAQQPSPSLNVNEKVNTLQQEYNLVTTALGDNLLVNPDFEQGALGWNSCGGATDYSLTTDSVSGQAAKLSTGCFYQTVDATAGTELSLSCKTKIATNTGWSGMGFGYTDSNFATLEEAPVQTMSGSGFRDYLTTLTAPANTEYASIWVYTDGTVHIDDCRLGAGVPPAPQGNLLSNPSFTSSADWFNCGDANNWNIASGNLNLTGTACLYQTNNAQANLQYNLSCTSKRDAGIYTTLIMSALDSGYQSIGQEIGLIESTSFQAKQISLTTPANTKYVAVTFYGEGATNHQECSLTTGDGATPPTPTNQAPSVVITSPSNDITLVEGSNVFVTADASDSDGTVQHVELFINDTLVAQDGTVPYQWQVQSILRNLSAGNYTLRTEATDNDGATASNTVTFQVQAVPVVNDSGLGKWSGVQSWPLIATHLANLKDGRILAWSSVDTDRIRGNPDDIHTEATIYDPNTNTFQQVNNPTHNMFCAGLVTLSDGTILAAGGGFATDQLKKVSIFNGDSWERIADMPNNHWYGTGVVDAEDNVLVSLGKGEDANDYLPKNGTWRTLTDITLAGTTQAGLNEPDSYPSLHLTPRGTIFHSGPTVEMHEINVSGNGNATSVGTRNQDGVTDEVYRQWGNAIMIDEGKIMLNGGTPRIGRADSSLNTSVIIDVNSSNPVVTKIAPMRYSRTYQNTILLPNGEIFVVGGNATGAGFSDVESRLTPEIYNPTTDSWRDVAAMSVPRNYHSTAILLQDGRVLAAGGGLCNCSANHQDSEIYSPSYLFNTDGSPAARPVISQAPSNIEYNQTFNVSITGAGANNITRFSLIKFSTNTHGVNTDLRQDVLNLSNQGNGNYSLTSHSNKNVVTPGYYFLFAVNSSGVPSVAKIVQITSPTRTTLYQHGNYRGNAYDLGVGNYSSLADVGIPNNQISSLKVTEGYTVELYENTNFGGRKIVVTSDSNIVQTFNDLASSAKVYKN